MKILNKLHYRKLEEKHMIIIMKYLNKEIVWLEAHNKLIPLGIYLKENGTLLDY